MAKLLTDIRDAKDKLTIKVEFHLTREFRFRKWLATRLIFLAACILKCGIQVEDSKGEQGE